MTPTPTEAPHGIWETVFIPIKGGRPYKDGRYVIQCKCCYAESPAHRPDCEFAASEQARQLALEDARTMKACWDASCNELHELEQARQRAETENHALRVMLNEETGDSDAEIDAMLKDYVAALAQTKEPLPYQPGYERGSP